MANELTAILVVIRAAKYYIRHLQSLEIIFRKMNSRFRLCKYYSKLAFLLNYDLVTVGITTKFK